jgi:hypothetical protein
MLVHYRQEHGDCLALYQSYKVDRSLSRWVETQRKLYANNKLRSDRRSKLESIGFVWVGGECLTNNKEKWENTFAKLEKNRRQLGDSLVPQH